MIVGTAVPPFTDLTSRYVGLLEARIAIVSNNADMIFDRRYFTDPVMESLVTDYRRVDELPLESGYDARILALDQPQLQPGIAADACGVTAVAPFSKWEAASRDRRFTLFGNQGLLYRFALRVLEERYQISSFHANAVYSSERNELVIAMGGGNSGKSPVLLAAVSNGYEVFATELVHVRVHKGNVEFFKGSVVDNIRVGNLLYDFPELISTIRVPDGALDPWELKIPVDFTAWEAKPAILSNARFRIIVPKVEAGRVPSIRVPLRGAGLAKVLFDNASEKIGTSFTMYDRLASSGFDDAHLAAARYLRMQALAASHDLVNAESVIATARAFLEIVA